MVKYEKTSVNLKKQILSNNSSILLSMYLNHLYCLERWDFTPSIFL